MRRKSVSQTHVITWSDSVSRFKHAERMCPFERNNQGQRRIFQITPFLSLFLAWCPFHWIEDDLFAVKLADGLQGTTVSQLLKLDFTCLGAEMVCLHLGSKLKAYNWRCKELVFHQQTPPDTVCSYIKNPVLQFQFQSCKFCKILFYHKDRCMKWDM